MLAEDAEIEGADGPPGVDDLAGLGEPRGEAWGQVCKNTAQECECERALQSQSAQLVRLRNPRCHKRTFPLPVRPTKNPTVSLSYSYQSNPNTHQSQSAVQRPP